MSSTDAKATRVYRFPGEEGDISQVGGKGYSLLKMALAGMPVPSGFVLSTGFFTAWLDGIEKSEPWQVLANVVEHFKGGGSSEEGALEVFPPLLRQAADEVKAFALTLPFDEERRHLLHNEFEICFCDIDTPIVAVRSSSPEEDTSGASFAGMYETRLGVNHNQLEAAVRECFASCLDSRIIEYKLQRGFGVATPRIAVVVQRQIQSDVSGVAFSVNPLNNSSDEVLINANFGLGESVVAGMCTPDEYIVDRVYHDVISRNVGKKEMSIWLAKDGGVTEGPAAHREHSSLTDEQALTVAANAEMAEHYYGVPIDTEWAFEKGEFYLLQARPITTLFPLPACLRTQPGEPRRIYFDATLCVQGIRDPLSVLGEDWLLRLLTDAARRLCGARRNAAGREKEHNLVLMTGGRMYVDATKIVKIAGKEKFARFLTNMDPTAGRLVAELNDERYDLPLPRGLRWLKPAMLFHSSNLVLKTILAARFPARQRREYLRHADSLCRTLDRLEEANLPLDQLLQRVHRKLITTVLHHGLPSMIVAMRAMLALRSQFQNDDEKYQRMVEMLDRGLPDNITTQMGRALGQLAKRICNSGETAVSNAEDLARRIETGQMSQDFLDEWGGFLKRFGFRGPGELDIAATRYTDDPKMLIDLLFQLLDQSEANSPDAVFVRNQDERHAAREALSRRAHARSKAEGQRFDRAANRLVSLFGLRETHKYLLIKANVILKRAVLKAGDRLFAKDRIDHRADVFNLRLEDLIEAARNPRLDLRAQIVRHAKERSPYDPNVVPRLIDSRGEIPRPPRRHAKEGELVGEPISPGVARGAVKVLRRPDEKLVLPGDILVAPATDPGWTPLFINASAIVLELGGALQHGTLVAREYGKPCVTGVEDACRLLEHQKEIEVDGDSGVIRLL
jgi:phosphohistidine swiveling domain-containing protein